jgi:hypothetical protein
LLEVRGGTYTSMKGVPKLSELLLAWCSLLSRPSGFR